MACKVMRSDEFCGWFSDIEGRVSRAPDETEFLRMLVLAMATIICVALECNPALYNAMLIFNMAVRMLPFVNSAINSSKDTRYASQSKTILVAFFVTPFAGPKAP